MVRCDAPLKLGAREPVGRETSDVSCVLLLLSEDSENCSLCFRSPFPAVKTVSIQLQPGSGCVCVGHFLSWTFTLRPAPSRGL